MCSSRINTISKQATSRYCSLLAFHCLHLEGTPAAWIAYHKIYNFLLKDIPLQEILNLWRRYPFFVSHLGRRVTGILNRYYGNRWIGRGGQHAWPSLAREFSTLHFDLCEKKIKESVTQSAYQLMHSLNFILKHFKFFFRNAPTCFNHSIIIRELSVPC